jgi:hypothetical protein
VAVNSDAAATIKKDALTGMASGLGRAASSTVAAAMGSGGLYAKENGSVVSSLGRKTMASGPALSERRGFYTRWSGDGRAMHHHQVDDDPRQAGLARGRCH